MNKHQFPSHLIWKSFVAVLLVLLAFQSFGITGLASPVTPSFNFQQEVPLTCTPSAGSTQAFCNVQVVFLIDDSGSMKTNDPQNNPNGGLRNQGAKNAVDVLARNYYLNAVNFNKDNPDIPLPVVQVAVIHFSYEIKNKDVDWITINPASTEEWESQKLELFELIDRRNPGYELTSFIEPFEKARDLLDGSNPGGDCTRQSILLFTDGVPEAAKGRLVGQDLENHKDAVARTVTEIQENQTREQVEIYVTGFKVAQTYWTPVQDFWTEIAKSPIGDDEPKHSDLLANEDALTQLASRMEDITAKLIGLERVTLVSDSLNVPRHLQTLRLTLYHLDPEASLQITDPDGRRITAGDSNVTVSGEDTAIEVWQLITPPAGSYTVQASKAGGIVTELRTYQSLSANLVVEPSPLQAGQPGVIRFTLVDGSGETVLPDEEPLKLNVTVTQDSQELPIEWTGEAFQFPWTPRSEGKSEFDVVASLVNASGDQLLGCSGNLEVDAVSTPLEELSMAITPPACVSPAEGANLPVQLNYNGTDGTWASSLQWDVRSKANPSGKNQNVPVTPKSIDGVSGLYELRIDPFPDSAEDQEVEVSAKAQLTGRSPEISDSQTIKIAVCQQPVCSCDAVWEIWFWPLLIALAGLLIVLLVLKFRAASTEKEYREYKRELSRTGYWHLLFWPALILLILLILNRLLWCCILPPWLFLILILILLIIFFLVWFIPREPGGRWPWWLVILLLLLVLIWYIFFKTQLIYLLWLLLILIFIIWIIRWYKTSERPVSTWWLLILLLFVASIWIVLFGGFPIWLILIWLLMWLVVLLLGWVLSRVVEWKGSVQFWLLVIFGLAMAVLWYIFFEGYWIYLFWMLLLAILLIWYLLDSLREPKPDFSLWLWILLTLIVSIWFSVFGSFPLWLILLLLLLWMGVLALVWIFFREIERRKTFQPWVVLVLLLALALVAFLYFSTFWTYLLLWLLVILVLNWIILWLIPFTPVSKDERDGIKPGDDLKLIEGIGPEVEKLLNSRGIYTFRQVVNADLDELNRWLNERGWAYMDPKTWLDQAELADKAKTSGKKEDWDKFYKYTAWLKDGIAPEEYNKPEKTRKPPDKSG